MKQEISSFEALKWTNKTQVVYVSFSKHQFYLRAHISSFVLRQGFTPISPFMNFDYNLADLVSRDAIRIANNTLLAKCDELWVFGSISDGVLVEVYQAQRRGIAIRYWNSTKQGEFREVGAGDVRLEDVSDWMWDMVCGGQSLERWHPRLRFHKAYPLVYPAYSKRNFYWQMHISQFCLEQKVVPLNPFMLFRYFLGDAVPRSTVYQANNTIVQIADEVWTFGDIADGVLAEVKLKQDSGGNVRYYTISQTDPIRFRRVRPAALVFEEPELERFRQWL